MEKFFLEPGILLFAFIDFQENLAQVMPDREKVIKNVLLLLEGARLFQVPIILTEQYPQGLGRTIKAVQEALPAYQPIEKVEFNCCRVPMFSQALKAARRRNVVLCGIETHICVLQTALGLIREGYPVQVIRDASCSRTPENHQTGLELLGQAGAVITTTEIVLFQLLAKAGTAAFKELMPKIK